MEFEELNKIVNGKLGKSLNIEDKFSVSNLNDFSVDLIEDARKLENPYYSESFLKFYIQQKDWKYLRAFTHQVILGNESGALWRKGRILIPDVSLYDQLTKEKENIYGIYYTKLFFIIKPSKHAWLDGVGTIGAFVIEEKDADYTTPIPSGFISLDTADLVAIETNKTDIIFRRWIATRIAMCLKSMDFITDFNQTQKLLEQYADKALWTNDAKKALEGLIKEKQNYNWENEDIPGFCGDDSWYL